MDYLKTVIENEKRRIESILARLDAGDAAADSSSGCTVIKVKRGGGTYFYSRQSENGVRKTRYLGKINSAELAEIKERELNRRLAKILKADLHVLDLLARRYKGFSIKELESILPSALRDVPACCSFDAAYARIREWAGADYKRNTTPFTGRRIYAADGTRVRSKGECIWYNLLLDAGVPFRYDPVLDWIDELDDDGYHVVVSPDFHIKCCDGREILVEHAGFLKRIKYGMDLVHKIRIYMQHGFTLGDNLIITSDDIDGGTDSVVISKYVQEIAARVFRIPAR